MLVLTPGDWQPGAPIESHRDRPCLRRYPHGLAGAPGQAGRDRFLGDLVRPLPEINSPLERLGRGLPRQAARLHRHHGCRKCGDNRALYRLYASASNGECPIQIDSSTPSCGNSRFGCWTCTVVERDKASEGLLANGDERMEHLLKFRDKLLEFRDPANGWRDRHRMNGDEGPGPLTIEARRELLKCLLELQQATNLKLISDEELLLVQQLWKAARDPDDGRGVARIVNGIRGTVMNDLKQAGRLQQLQDEVCGEKNISPETLRRLLAVVEQYTDSHRAVGLPDELLRILNDELHANENVTVVESE